MRDSSDLLRWFIAEECSPAVREMLLADLALPLPREITQHRFNVFDVRIDHVPRTATLDVVFDTSPTGRLVLSMDAFAAALRGPPPGAQPR